MKRGYTMQNRPNREDLMSGRENLKSDYYKQAIVIDKHLPKTLKAGDYLLSIDKNHHPLDVGYTKEAKKELSIILTRPELRNKFSITANSNIVCFTQDVEIKEEWFDAE